MPIRDLLDALDALDTFNRLADLTALFPHLRSRRGGGFAPSIDVGWNPMLLRLLAQIDAAAASAAGEIGIVEVKEKFGLLRIYLDLGAPNAMLRDRCDALVRKAEAESAQRCQFCGAMGEVVRSRTFLSVLCAAHETIRTTGETTRAPRLSAHARLRLAGRFDAGNWREVRPLSGGALLRAHAVDEGFAFAVSLRADPEGAGAPSVVTAALGNADGSLLDIWGDDVMSREADLAARIEAEVRGC